MNIASFLTASALSFGDRPAVSLGKDCVFSYRQLGQRAASLSAHLSAQFEPGERVAISLQNCVEYLEILFGIWGAGLAVAPLNARLNADELAYMIDDCGARIAFADEDLADALSRLLPGVRIIVPGKSEYRKVIAGEQADLTPRLPSDLAWIFYTSGTTGKPKGAMLSHAAVRAMTMGYFADIDHLSERDGLIHLAATSHASGLFGLSHVAKASNNILPESGSFQPDEFAELINTYEKLSFFAPNIVLRRINHHEQIKAAKLDNIKTILLGAAPVNATDLSQALSTFGSRIWHGYGQGESPCTITAMSKTMLHDAFIAGREDQLSSVGIARTGIEVRIMTPDGTIAAPMEVGEVEVRGPTVMQGYLNNPEATAETLRDGWLLTGDLGRLDPDGVLTLLDRKKDLIISGGMNIYAREIEDVLLELPAVGEAAVIGIPDPEWGESVMALIVPAHGASPEAAVLDSHCLSRVARFKRPKHYAFVESLPKNASGKVLKKELRARYGQG